MLLLSFSIKAQSAVCATTVCGTYGNSDLKNIAKYLANILSVVTPTATPWYLVGNSSTDSTTNWLGTNDNRPVSFRSFGVERLRIEAGGKFNFSANNVNTANFNFANGSIVTSPVNGDFWRDNNGLNFYTTVSSRPMRLATANGTLGFIIGVGSTQFGSVSNSDLGFFTNNGGNKLFLSNTSSYCGILDNVYLGATGTIPNALLQIKAGTTSLQQIRLNSGALATGTNIISGGIEFVAPTFYMTVNTGTTSTDRVEIAGILKGSATLDFGNTLAGAVSDLTLTCTGAVSGDKVNLGVPGGSVPAGGGFFAWVSASDEVTVRYFNNNLVTAYDPASGTFKVSVQKN